MKKTLKLSVLFLFIILISIISFVPNNVIAVSTDQFLGQVQLGGDTIGIQIKKVYKPKVCLKRLSYKLKI